MASIAEGVMDHVLGHNAWLLDCNVSAVEYEKLFETHNIVVVAWLHDDGPVGNIRVKCLTGHAPLLLPTISVTVVPVSCEAAALDLKERYALRTEEVEPPTVLPSNVIAFPSRPT
jgi:hypothetical protein